MTSYHCFSEASELCGIAVHAVRLDILIIAMGVDTSIDTDVIVYTSAAGVDLVNLTKALAQVCNSITIITEYMLIS